MRSKAKTVAEYLKSLPEDRRAVLAALRKLILKHLPKGYQESMNFGMIAYEIPLSRYPKTYNKQPLMLASLASQKNYVTLYLMNLYVEKDLEKWFRGEFKKAGKAIDLGKSCLRFQSLNDLALPAIGELIGKVSVEDYIRHYELSRK